MNSIQLSELSSKIMGRYKRFLLLAQLRYKKEIIVSSKIKEKKIFFNVDSEREYLLRTKISYSHETITVDWLHDFVGVDDIVYDIGANVGSYSLLGGCIFKEAKSKGRVYSFEPFYGNYFRLNQNIRLNSLSEYVVAYNLAISDKRELTKFYLSSPDIGSACHSLGDEHLSITKFSQGAASYTMMDIADHLPFPNHIKIDVDGHEGKIINGNLPLLKDSRLKSLLIEIDERLSESMQVKKTIESAGLFEIKREYANSPNEEVYNILYARKG